MQVDQSKTVELMGNLRKEIRKVIDDNATAAAQVAVNSTDPHLPIVTCLQMAFLQSASEYMIVNGATMQEAIPAVINAMQNSIHAWMSKCVTIQPLKKPKRIMTPKKSKLILPGE